MIIVACLTGMNAAELTGLKWKRINLSDSWATSDGESLPPWSLLVREQWILASKAKGGHRFGPVKRKSRRRPLPIPDVLRDVLAGLRARREYVGPDDPVFVGGTGKPVDHHNLANRGLKKLGEALKMPWLSWHVFRRTNTTLADELGLSLQDRQSLMGHSDAAMTMHYTKESMDRRRDVLDLMGGAIGKVM